MMMMMMMRSTITVSAIQMDTGKNTCEREDINQKPNKIALQWVQQTKHDPLQCFSFPLRSSVYTNTIVHQPGKPRDFSWHLNKEQPSLSMTFTLSHLLTDVLCQIQWQLGNQQPRPQCPCTSCFSGSAVACAGCLLAIRDLIWSTVCFEYQMMLYPMLRFI